MVSRITLGRSPMVRLGLGLGFLASAMAFDMTRSNNLAVYWGQNSYGATNPDNKTAWQQSIEFYCGDDTIDTLPIAFLNEFYSTGDLPTINISNTCSTTDDPVYPGTNLPNCSFLAAGIETCQKAGKIVTLSIGGATGNVGFASDSDGKAFAKVIWDLFLGGSSSTRPFGTAILDGVDLDIEGGGQTGYVAFLTALRDLMNGGNKKYYITAAPQCPFPDSYIGTTLSAFGFDAVYVQFYNNYCGLPNFANVNAWDFSAWDEWAKNTSPNKDVKVYIGAPASSGAAGSGFVDSSTLASIISETKSKYSSFGGVMLWDASQAYANGKYHQAVKSVLGGSGGSAPTTSPTQPASTSTSATPSPSPTATSVARSATSKLLLAVPTTPTFTTSKTSSPLSTATATATGSPGQCAGVSAWQPNVVYLSGNEVTYNNQLWQAKWWTYADEPGGSAQVWTLIGSC